MIRLEPETPGLRTVTLDFLAAIAALPLKLNVARPITLSASLDPSSTCATKPATGPVRAGASVEPA